jgi:hypothetical protein
MCLRRAVLQIPPKSSVPPRLLLDNRILLLNSYKSTLLQMLISPHFNSPRVNTYKKPGRGYASRIPTVTQLVTTQRSPHRAYTSAHLMQPSRTLILVSSYFSPFNFKLSTLNSLPVTPFSATLTGHSQLTENALTSSPVSTNLDAASSISRWLATLTENTGGGGGYFTLSSRAVSR